VTDEVVELTLLASLVGEGVLVYVSLVAAVVLVRKELLELVLTVLLDDEVGVVRTVLRVGDDEGAEVVVVE
jgi:hypothetical protein